MSTQKPISLFHRLPIALVIVATTLSFDRRPAAAQGSVVTVPAMQRVVTLPPGTKVDSAKENQRWNRLLLLATPKINSGDVDQLSESIRQAATGLTLTIMATIEPTNNQTGFALREVGVGYSVLIAGQQTVITSATQSQLGANLGFIQRRVLTNNELGLADLRSIVQTTTLFMFDAPAIMHRNAKHRDYVMRHLVWIDNETGSSAMLVWLLDSDTSGKQSPANEPLRIVTAGTKEQRNVHVDGNEFTFGFPSQRAFALEDLPPGVDVAWTKELAAVAALPSYDAKNLATLSAAVNSATKGATKAATKDATKGVTKSATESASSPSSQ